jgi:hypothetical protein
VPFRLLERAWLPLAASLLLVGVRAPAAPSPEAAGPVAPAEVRQGLVRLRQDPNVVRGERTHELTWIRTSEQPELNLPSWLRAGFRSADNGGRVLLWIAVGIGAAGLIVYLLRLANQRVATGRLAQLPTHVLTLDIRPESLPADVGAAALALWEHGEPRAALALLYRGMLSRLVHAHGTPIRASFTEEDCAAAAARRVTAAQLGFVRSLIGMWQAAVYGGQTPLPARFKEACAALDTALPPGGAA